MQEYFKKTQSQDIDLTKKTEPIKIIDLDSINNLNF